MARATAVGAAILFAACSFNQGGVSFVDGGQDPRIDAAAPIDGAVGIDASTPDACAASCESIVPSNGVDQDQLSGVTTGLAFGAGSTSTINTDDGQVVTGGGTIVRGPGGGVVDGVRFEQLSGSVAVLGVSELFLAQDAYVRVVGSRALIVLSAGNVTINGAIDVSGGCIAGGVTCAGPGGGTGTPHEGTPATGCAPGGNGGGGNGLPPETGGGGGSFGTAGGPGGGDGASDPGGVAGVLPGTCSGATLVPLMGGGAGGSGGIDGDGGDGGGGGGGLQITSYTRIDLIGPGMAGRPVGIIASGAGGRGGEASDGGGGGGAGGGILLESPVINLSNATVAANGGGGGGGGNDPDGSIGQSGLFGSAQAVGGDDDRQGGSGGSADGAATGGEGGGDDCGGGGGGTGIIRFNVGQTGLILDPNVVISPAFTRGDLTVR